MRRGAIWMAMLLAGCASQRDDYPSLAHRPIENGNFDEPVRAAPALAPDPALDRQIAATADALTAAAAAFDKALPGAELRADAARGKPAGSDAWIDAQQGLATLDDSLARVAALRAEIDTAASDRAAKLEPPYPTLDALGGRIAAEAMRERAAAERLQTMLTPG